MCGIGKTMAVAECETVAGPTDATITTEVPSIVVPILHKMLISFPGSLQRRLQQLRCSGRDRLLPVAHLHQLPQELRTLSRSTNVGIDDCQLDNVFIGPPK